LRETLDPTAVPNHSYFTQAALSTFKEGHMQQYTTQREQYVRVSTN